MSSGFERYEGYGHLKILVIYINPLIFIIYKNGPNINLV